MKQFTERFRAALGRLLISSLLLALLGAGTREARAVGGLTFAMPPTNAAPGAVVVVPVQASQFASILTFQFSLHWDPAIAEFLGVESFGLPGLGSGNFGTTLTNNGTLTVSWDDPDGVGKMAADGTTLFGVRLRVIGSVGAISALTIDGTPTPIEAANDLGETLPVSIAAGQLSITPAGVAPTIMTQPQGQTVTVGDASSFSVMATGTATLGYQWRLNGANLASATTSMLTLENVQLSQAGDYTVVVANNFGSVTSAVARLTVNPPVDTTPPMITAQPQGQTVTVSNGASFMVTATGAAPLGYQWRLNGANLASATASTLTLANVQLSQAGDYTVVVANNFGSVTSAVARLTVNPPVDTTPPMITAQPQGQTVTVSNGASFMVTATGAAPLGYQWRLNGANVASATASTLTLANVQLSQAGDYTVVVANNFGSVTSAVARLTVNPPVDTTPPMITAQPQGQTVTVSNGASFMVTATGAAPLGYQWRLNGANLASATASTLTLANVQLSQAGDYTVVVANNFGSVTSAVARLTVNPPVDTTPPMITAQPQGQTVTVSNGASFMVTATGAAPLGYQWRLNGANLASATASTLTLANVQLSQAGDYTVVVANNFGSVTSAVARLTVNPPVDTTPPMITAQPQGQTVTVSNGASFMVTATGAAPLGYQWRLNGANLASATASTLTLANVQLSQAGDYTVVVANNFGSVTSAVARLTVNPPVDTTPPMITAQPQGQTVTVSNGASFMVTATGAAPLGYQWRLNGANLASATASTLTLANVQLSQAGDYTVVVANNFGSVTSAVARLTVNPPIDTTPPTITITSPTSSPTYSTTSSSLSVAGLSGDNVGVTQVVWVNSRGGSGTASGTTIWAVTGIMLQSGTNVIIVTARDAANNTAVDTLSIVYTLPNTAPTISDITDKHTDRNQPTPEIPFTVGDAEVLPGTLSVSATSSNPALIAAASILFSGTGANRTVRLQPETNQVGTSMITVTVSDGTLSTSDSFLLTVEISGLISHWKFDEASGVGAIDSVGGNIGTLSNGVGRGTGKVDGGLIFDGIDDVVSVPDSNSLDLSNRLTIALWFKPSRLLNSLSGRKDLLKKLNSYWLMIGYPQSDGKLAFVFNSGSPLVKSTTSSWQSNTWYQAVATYDGAQMRLYVNGTLESTAATTLPANINASALQIGGNSDFSIYFPGCIDDVRLYNVALSAGEVSDLFISSTANLPPSLVPTGNRSIDEGSALNFTVVGTDLDAPAQRLTYSLDPDPPIGASINPNSGLFTWTPTEAQGPSTNTVVIRVTDNGTPALSATETITIIVNEVNVAPTLAAIANRTVMEGTMTGFSVPASDTDLPPQALSYRLGLGAPQGASINAAGFFTWTPTEEQGPGASVISIIVTDNGPLSLGATQSFTINVLEANNAPTFLSVPDQNAQVLTTLRVTNVVTDTDMPANQITFIIASGPKGARINKFTGVVSWTPDRSQAPSTNFITVIASDDGVPPYSVTNVFRVTVDDFVELALGSSVIRAGQSGNVSLNMLATTSVTNLNSLFLASDERLGNLGLTMLAPELGSGSLLPQAPGTRMLNLGTLPGQSIQGSRLLGRINFMATSPRSAFVPLSLENITAMRQSGAPVPRTFASPGRVIVVGDEPLLEAVISTNQQRYLVLYGEPGAGYVVQSSLVSNPSLWQTAWQGSLTNLSQIIQPPAVSNSTIFYRAFRQ